MQGIGEDPFDVLPFTILVVLKGTDPSRWLGWTTFVEAYKRYAAKPGCKNMWLLKPTMWVLSSSSCCLLE